MTNCLEAVCLGQTWDDVSTKINDDSCGRDPQEKVRSHFHLQWKQGGRQHPWGTLQQPLSQQDHQRVTLVADSQSTLPKVEHVHV